MDLKKLLCSAAVATLSLAGCKSDGDDTTAGSDGGTRDSSVATGTYCSGTTATGGMTKTYVISALASGTISNDNKIAGFNLDGTNHGVCDPEGAEGDDPSGTPPDNFTGVDNTFGINLAPTLGGLIAGSGPGLADLFTTNINDGTILILLQVSGIDDFTNDNCVAISGFLGKVPGEGMPETTSGRLTPGQTFDVDPASIIGGQPLIRFSSAGIVNGRLDVTPADFPLVIPVGGASLSVTIKDTHARFNITADALTQGVLGGSLEIADIVDAWDALQQENMNRAAMDMMTINLPAISASSLENTLVTFADLQPGSSGGPPCEAISVGFTLSGVSAVLGANAL